VVNDK
jgi:hypothetical protein